MSSKFDADKIAESLCIKTESGDIIWNMYDFMKDTNFYSVKYFSTIPILDGRNGYVAEYNQGFIYLIPDYQNRHGLIIQSNSNFPPTCINYDHGFLVPYSSIETLYCLVSKPFEDLDNFIDKIIN